MQGLKLKLDTFVQYMSEFDIVLLMETFVEEKDIDQIESALPDKYNYTWIESRRESERGRSEGGLMLAIDKRIKTDHIMTFKNEWTIQADVQINNRRTRLIGVYNQIKQAKIGTATHKRCKEAMEGEMAVILTGDLNARIGPLCCIKGGERNTTDKTIDIEGRRWAKIVQEHNLILLNGNTDGDWSGQTTRKGTRGTVIDYTCVSRSLYDEIADFKIGDFVESDHFPMEITIKEDIAVLPTLRTIRSWKSPREKEYRDNLDDSLKRLGRTDWETLRRSIQRAIPTKTIQPHKRLRQWFDEECLISRQEVWWALHKARTDDKFWEVYIRLRRNYKDLLKQKKRQELDKFEAKLKEVRNLNDAWQFINQERQSATRSRTLPNQDELTRHFKASLEGADTITRRSTSKSPIRLIFTQDELDTVINNLKMRKSCGPDEIPAEAMKYGGPILRTTILNLMNDYGSGKPIPDDFRLSKLIPVHKKGPKMDAANYRGICVSNTIYKIWTQLLLSRLTKEVSHRNIIPDTQAGFRKGRSTMDNIYIMNTLIKSRLAANKRLYAMFIDLKAAFDKIPREKMWTKLDRLNLAPDILDNVKEIYDATPVLCGDEKFYLTKGVKQGCPLSPMLFSLYTYDLEKILTKAQAGGVAINQTRLHSLMYADDMVIFGEDINNLKDAIRVTRNYFDKIGLIFNPDKSKIMTFSRGGRRSTQEWEWRTDEPIDEVAEYVYLGVVMTNRGTFDRHIETLTTRATSRMTETWTIGEKRFEDNFYLRMNMFDSLVLPGAIYGCEVFGQTKFEELELMHRRYLKWTLGLNSDTRTSLLMYETKRTPIFLTTTSRARDYEKKAINGTNRLLAACAKWTKRNRTDLERPIEDLTNQFWEETLTTCTESYRKIATPRLPTYLLNRRHIKKIARARCENEEWGRRSWGSRTCRGCTDGLETIEHMTENCIPDDRTREEILHEDGDGIDFILKMTTT